MANQVSRQNNVVYYQFIGDQTQAGIMEIAPQARALCQELKNEGRPVLFLVDLTQIGSQDAGARKASADELDSLPVDKVAIFGANLLIKYVARFIVNASHQSNITKYFDTKEAALDWLTS